LHAFWKSDRCPFALGGLRYRCLNAWWIVGGLVVGSFVGGLVERVGNQEMSEILGFSDLQKVDGRQ
jgi:hypothetical protein